MSLAVAPGELQLSLRPVSFSFPGIAYLSETTSLAAAFAVY